MINNPFTVPCKYGETPNIFSMLFIIPRSIAPKTAPDIYPLPPAIDVPPITTAEIASNSKFSPALEELIEFNLDDKRKEEMATEIPTIIYEITLTLSTLIAAYWATFSFDPIAQIYLQYLVLFNII